MHPRRRRGDKARKRAKERSKHIVAAACMATGS